MFTFILTDNYTIYVLMEISQAATDREQPTVKLHQQKSTVKGKVMLLIKECT